MSKIFKIIAIRPLIGCKAQFRKSLIPGQIYQFFNNYDIQYDIDSSSIINIIKRPHISEEIYNLKNGININISAVVGKNGSGKSTLFDLLYLFIYILSSDNSINSESVIKKYLFDLDDQLDDVRRDYNYIKDWNENLNQDNLIELSDICKRHDLDLDLRITLNPLDFLKKVNSLLGNKLHYLAAERKDELESEEKISSDLKMSVIYEVDGTIYELTHIKGSFGYASYSQGKKQHLKFKNDFSLSNFFYNVCLNYSHHSLNSIVSGKWIMKLFHKNDGYITPVVINPMRNEGSFDINREIDLSKERLMINVIHALVRSKKFLLLDKYEVTGIIFSPKKPAPFLSKEGSNKLEDFTSSFLIESVLTEDDLKSLGYYKDNALGYLEKKLPKIKRNYKQIIFEGKKGIDKEFRAFVKKDKSHITKKVRQTLHFLGMTNSEDKQSYWQVPKGTVVKNFKITDYIDWMKLSVHQLEKFSPLELIEYAHPGFLSVDFELKALNGEVVKFGDLSSGEQQMIYNENTILYHLFNLQSVHQDSTRIKYSNINIILDEVELYYHPEMQQQLIQNLVKSFENVKGVDDDGIRAINVILCTHSPFILSDIPTSNILRLDNGSPNTQPVEKSFGANIHDILYDDFFMTNSFMGAFAKEKINQVITWLNYHKLKNDIAKLQLKEESKFKSSSLEMYLEEIEQISDDIKDIKRDYIESFIDLIDEPLLSKTMNDMYNSLDFDSTLNSAIQ